MFRPASGAKIPQTYELLDVIAAGALVLVALTEVDEALKICLKVRPRGAADRKHQCLTCVLGTVRCCDTPGLVRFFNIRQQAADRALLEHTRIHGEQLVEDFAVGHRVPTSVGAS